MKSTKTFPFKNARRITEAEVIKAREAIEKATGVKRRNRGRPPKEGHLKYCLISIRIDPRVLSWARKLGEKRGVGYQTVINQELLKKVA